MNWLLESRWALPFVTMFYVLGLLVMLTLIKLLWSVLNGTYEPPCP